MSPFDRPRFRSRVHPALVCVAGVAGVLAFGCHSTKPSAGGAGSSTGSGGGGGNAPAESLYVIPAALSDLADDHFMDHPWPSDLRLEQGSPRFTGYPNPRAVPIIDTYIQSIQGVLDGFSPAGAGYVRFQVPIDPTTLPANPDIALEPTASVQLIDIDSSSPEHGKRKLMSVELHTAAGVYYQPNTLAFQPTVGFPLRTHTQYALVVTDAVRGAGGEAIAPSPDLSAVLGLSATDARTAPAQAALAPTLVEIASAGIAKEHIVHLAVFTTADPTAELFAVRDDVHKSVAAPTADPMAWKVNSVQPNYVEYIGNYGPSPNYQAGNLPFANYGDGGQFNIVDGHPQVVNLFSLRFSLMIPNAANCPMPAAGYPIVMYAHGTGGDYETYVGDGSGESLAEQCIATMGVDQIFHGTRPGAPPDDNESDEELLFFNVENPVAARTNPRQSAIDEVQRARLFKESHMSVPASVSTTQTEILLDSTKLCFFGHSQGGLNGPLYFAADDSSRGGVLSGSSADMSITLLEKTEPEPSVAALVTTVFLALHPDEEAEVDLFHPAISLAQSIVDVADPLHYARHAIAEPRTGFAPKSVYMTEGINPDGTGDSYAPPPGIEAHGISMGLPLQIPFQHAISELQWGGPVPIMIPAGGLSGNLGGGDASGILAQWAVPPGTDGHFVVFNVPAARLQAATFIRNLANDPKGRIPAP